MKLKRLFSLIVTLSLCLCAFSLQAFADAPLNLPATMNAYLEDDMGNVEVATGHLVNTPVAYSNSDDISATYAFNLYRAGENITVYGEDSAYASTVYLTIHLSTTNQYQGTTLYRLDSVEAYWRVSDPDTRVTDANLVYGCSAIFPSVQTQRGSRSVNNNFYVSTGFDGYGEAYLGAIGATLTLDYQMGSRTWSFSLQNNL